MILYFLKSAACLGLLLAFYHLVLEKEKMHSFNRFYLLGSILFSFLAPLYTIYKEVKPLFIESSPVIIETTPTNFIPTETIAEQPINYTTIILFCYLTISAILLIRFGRNLYKIISKIRKNKKIKHEKAILVLVDDTILPHTFWNYIFINKKQYEQNEIEDELFTHELTHATQKHTADVLILELFQIAFWINPLFIFLKKAVQINHEFLADESVITQHKNTFQYQHLLLNKAAWKNEYYLASNLNYLVTKKRLKMMTTQSSPVKILFKKLAIIPLLTGFVFLFAERVEAQEIIEVVEEPKETIVEESKSISKKNFEKYKILVEKAKNSEIIKQKDVAWMTSTYRKMSNEQRKSVENIFHYIVADVSLSKRKVSENQLKKWQNKDEYAIWVDGKSKENSILENYKESDFSYYSESFVHKNARSKKFPQNYQVSIYTNKYFKEVVDKNSKIEEFEVIEEKVNNYQIETIEEQIYTKKGEAIKTGFKKLNGKNHFFVKLNNKVKYYNNGGKLVDKNGKVLNNKKANASSVFPDNYITRTFYNGKVFCEFKDDKPELRKANSKALKELLNGSKNIKEVKEQNKKAKKYIDAPLVENNYYPSNKGSLQSIPSETISLNDIRSKLKELNGLKLTYQNTDPKFNKDWYITIDGQKYYYTFDKNERIARYYKNGKLVELDVVKEYKKKHKIFESLKAKGKHYVFKTKKEQEEIEREFSDLGGMYFRMPRADKNKVPRPENPVKPYIRLRKGDKVWYKKFENLTEEEKLLLPPPPPMPNATKAEKEKATKAYKAWKKRVESKNVAKILSVKDTIPTKKTETKITLKNANTLEEKSFTKILQNLTEEEKKKNRKNVTYYLNGKVINQKDVKKIKTSTIKSTSVNRERDGSKSIKIVTKII